MKLSDISSIGRSLDLDYPSNRAIAVVTMVVMVGGTLFQRLSGGGWVESILWGINASPGIFLTWALCRELDPDHALSAFVAAGLAFVGLVFWGLPRLLVILWLITVMRVVNRTTGLSAGMLDSLAVLGLGSWLSLGGDWGYGAINGLALFLDSQLPRQSPRQRIFAALALTISLAIALVGVEPLWEGRPSVQGGLIGLAFSVVFLPVIVSARHPESVGDQSQEPLEPTRVQAAQVLALLTGVGTLIVEGTAAIGPLVPLWAAVLGASIFGLYRVVKS